MSKRDEQDIFDKVSDYVALVGRGQRSGKSYSQQQAQHIMHLMLSGQTLPEQTGALLMLLRMREETNVELAGFLQACRDTLPAEIKSLPSIDLDLGCYAGKRRHLPWLLLAVLCLAQKGYKILIHGLAESDSQRLYLDEVFKDLDWHQANNISTVKTQLDTHNFSYISIKDLHPGMTNLLSTRHILGLRNCLHSVAKMLNPANARASVHGVFHRELDNTHIEVAKLLGETQVSCIRGDSGEVEATPEKLFNMHVVDANGIEQVHEYPVLMENWAHQTRSRGSELLKQIWIGNEQCDYGVQATIGTLAVYLSTLHDLSPSDALKQASEMWDSREKTWPSIT